jgi:hypothetical protein
MSGWPERCRPFCPDIRLARPNAGRHGLMHQLAQLIRTIEVFAVPIRARLLCQHLKMIGIHLEQVDKVGPERGFGALIWDRAHRHLHPSRRITKSLEVTLVGPRGTVSDARHRKASFFQGASRAIFPGRAPPDISSTFGQSSLIVFATTGAVSSSLPGA